MDCARASQLLHGYLDSELDAVHVEEIETHLAACSACATQQAQELKLRSVLQAHAARHAAPARLRRQILTSVRSAQTTQRLRHWFPAGWLQFGGSLAVAVLLSSAITYIAIQPGGADRVTDEVVATHVRSLITQRLTDVESSDQHTVKPWFNGKVDFAPLVKDLAEQGFALVGGRLDYIDGRPVAALLYRHRQHWISVFMWPDPSGQNSAARSFSRRGYDVTQWSGGGLRFYMVSDIAAPERSRLVTLLRGESGSP